MNVYLASTSPRRRDLLRQLGLRFQVVTPAAVEDSHSVRHKTGAAPSRYAVECARSKALSVLERVGPGIVIGVDTIVVRGRHVLGKPRSKLEASRMLRLLSGRTHSVISGIAVVRIHAAPGSGVDARRKLLTAAETTEVEFRRLSEDEIDRYVTGPEPYDKAGAYAIQGQAAIFVSRVSGCLLNVVGLPVPLLLELLRKSGWRSARPTAGPDG